MSSTSPAITALPPQPQHMSAFQRMLAVFYAPARAFADLKDNTRWYTWVAPWLAIAISFAAFAFVVEKKIGFQQVFETSMRIQGPAAQERFDSMTPQQRAKAIPFVMMITKVQTYAWSVFLLAMWTLAALVLWGTFTFGAGAKLNFKTCMAVMMYANLVDVVKMVLAIVTILAGVDRDAFFVQNPVATNPGYFISFMDHRVLAALFMSIDVIRIWGLVLLGVGFAAVTKMKRFTALTCIFGWYAFITLVSIGFAAISK